jgi:enamine deaminase RidA (YjgF/YER057c/UK114 family)
MRAQYMSRRRFVVHNDEAGCADAKNSNGGRSAQLLARIFWHRICKETNSGDAAARCGATVTSIMQHLNRRLRERCGPASYMLFFKIYGRLIKEEEAIMQRILSRRDFVACSSAGVAAIAGTTLISFPLTPSAQGIRSATVPRGTYVMAAADLDLLILSGETALDLYHRHPHVPHEIVIPEGIEAQAHMVMRNLKEVLDDQNVTWAAVVKLNSFLKDITQYPIVETVLREYFDHWDWWPAMTAMEINRLSSAPALLEIELIAVVPRAG